MMITLFGMCLRGRTEAQRRERRFFEIKDSLSVPFSILAQVNDASRMDGRTLALIYLAHASDVLENAFAPLSDEDYELAMKRVRTLLDLDFEAEGKKNPSDEVLWSVVSTITK